MLQLDFTSLGCQSPCPTLFRLRLGWTRFINLIHNSACIHCSRNQKQSAGWHKIVMLFFWPYLYIGIVAYFENRFSFAHDLEQGTAIFRIWHRHGCMRTLSVCGLCAYIIVHTIVPSSPVILSTELGGKPKWLPLNIGFHDIVRTAHKLISVVFN